MNLLRKEEADKLRKILTKIGDELHLLLQFENEKYEALKSVDVRELLRLNTLEEEHLMVMSEYDRQRQVFIAELAEFHGLDVGLTLKGMAELFPDNTGQQLAELGDKIRHDSRRLGLTVRENQALIQANMEIIQMTLSYAGQEEKMGYEKNASTHYSESFSGLSELAMVNQFA